MLDGLKDFIDYVFNEVDEEILIWLMGTLIVIGVTLGIAILVGCFILNAYFGVFVTVLLLVGSPFLVAYINYKQDRKDDKGR